MHRVCVQHNVRSRLSIDEQPANPKSKRVQGSSSFSRVAVGQGQYNKGTYSFKLSNTPKYHNQVSHSTINRL
ncbi:hypothetical protein WN51_03582 [Melipona quadrifasciata]|uniref:Uncharacterized protein n=1 Tax=Melipona quadrifasciata TaxID=166423 RepID=A0A0N0BE44_9HYME|nr:hypothetical protein WN51_03582 [Melipona quadrifasciata]